MPIGPKQFAPFDQHLSTPGTFRAKDQPKHGRFAAARLTANGKKLPRPDRKIQVFENLPGRLTRCLILNCNISQFDHFTLP